MLKLLQVGGRVRAFVLADFGDSRETDGDTTCQPHFLKILLLTATWVAGHSKKLLEELRNEKFNFVHSVRVVTNGIVN
jgi:hypothetical protein